MNDGRIVAIVVAVLATLGCKSTRPASAQGNVERAGTVDSPPADNLGLVTLKESDIPPPRGVNAIRLDTIDFRVNAVRVGEALFLQYSAPVVSFEMPDRADYVEIIRCPSNLIISGGADRLDQAELNSPTLKDETRVFQRNNFWESAVASPGCIMVTSSYTDTLYLDSFAPTGKFYYYIHACVDPAHLINAAKYSSYNCSRQVTGSAEVNHTNQRDAKALADFQRASDLRSQIDTIRRSVGTKTGLLINALKACQDKNQGRALVTQGQIDNLSTILAASAGAGGALLGGGGALAKAKGAGTRTMIGAGIGGAIVGGAVGASLGYLTGMIANSLTFKIDGMPADDASCYQRNDSGLISSEQTASTRICSCADVEVLEGDLRSMKTRLEQMMQVHDGIYQKYGDPTAEKK